MYKAVKKKQMHPHAYGNGVETLYLSWTMETSKTFSPSPGASWRIGMGLLGAPQLNFVTGGCALWRCCCCCWRFQIDNSFFFFCLLPPHSPLLQYSCTCTIVVNRIGWHERIDNFVKSFLLFNGVFRTPNEEWSFQDEWKKLSDNEQERIELKSFFYIHFFIFASWPFMNVKDTFFLPNESRARVTWRKLRPCVETSSHFSRSHYAESGGMQ